MCVRVYCPGYNMPERLTFQAPPSTRQEQEGTVQCCTLSLFSFISADKKIAATALPYWGQSGMLNMCDFFRFIFFRNLCQDVQFFVCRFCCCTVWDFQNIVWLLLADKTNFLNESWHSQRSTDCLPVQWNNLVNQPLFHVKLSLQLGCQTIFIDGYYET